MAAAAPAAAPNPMTEQIMPFMGAFEEKSRELIKSGYSYMLVASPKGSSTCFVSAPSHCKTDKLRVSYDTAIKECTYLLTGKRPLAPHFLELPKREQELSDLKEKLTANLAHLRLLEDEKAARINAAADAKALKKILSAKGAMATRYNDSGVGKKFGVFVRDNVFFDDSKSGVLFFAEGKDRTEHAANAIPIASITAIAVGAESAAVKKAGEKAKPDCCFSVVSKEHTLDLETKLPKTRDTIVRGLVAFARGKGIVFKLDGGKWSRG